MSNRHDQDTTTPQTRVGLATTLGDAGPTLLPDPSTTAVPNPPFPEGLTDEERTHLVTFDEMDFEVFSHAEFARFGESHAPNVRVHWPDGHYTDGLERHVADMAAIFAFAPDSHIHSHPLRIAQGNLTCVIGVMAGTFTRPMADGRGGHIAPTNRPYSINMATVGVWNKNGTMDEEWLYWDNQTFYAQLGTVGPITS